MVVYVWVCAYALSDSMRLGRTTIDLWVTGSLTGGAEFGGNDAIAMVMRITLLTI